MSDTAMSTEVRVPNPHRIGACPYCGSYRSDGRPPFLHSPGCRNEDALQIDRWMCELQSRYYGDPVLYCDDPAHDHHVPAGGPQQ